MVGALDSFDDVSGQPLEDEAVDIIEKAQAGYELSDAVLAARLGVDPSRLERIKSRGGGELAPLARELQLNAPALQAMMEGTYHPAVEAPSGLLQVATSFETMRVNAYLVWNEETKDAVAFDTGADASALMEFVDRHGLTPRAILLTHAHRDHVADLERLRRAWGTPVYIGQSEDFPDGEGFEAGKRFEFGGVVAETRLTWGHSRGGVTYVVDNGGVTPIAVVGDAIFAGSMGGGRVSYLDALRTNREQIFTLPDNTVVCPGHGPLTTIDSEKRGNPFFAGAFG